MPNIDTLQKISTFLNIPTEKLFVNDEKVICRKSKKETITGFCTILQEIVKNCSHEVARNSIFSLEIFAQVQSWLDYACLYIQAGKDDKHICKQLLQELNHYLSDKSYLVSQKMTIADIVLFYSLYDLIKKQTPVERENLLNLSRWFDHLQQIKGIRQNLEVLNFTTIYLHGWATGTR